VLIACAHFSSIHAPPGEFHLRRTTLAIGPRRVRRPLQPAPSPQSRQQRPSDQETRTTVPLNLRIRRRPAMSLKRYTSSAATSMSTSEPRKRPVQATRPSSGTLQARRSAI
jgi:hypothetical protein